MSQLNDRRPITILRLKQLQERVGLSRSSIYDRLNPRSPRFEPAFPTPIRLGLGAVGWVSSEVETYLENRIAASRSQPREISEGITNGKGRRTCSAEERGVTEEHETHF